MFRKILVALDGTPEAESALPWVQPYAEGGKARLVLIQVVSPGEIPLAFTRRSIVPELAEARMYLDRVARSLKSKGYRAKVAVVSGRNTSKALADWARKENCDLVAMVTRGRAGITRWLRGGHSEQVLHGADRPVLVVRGRTPPSKEGWIRRVLVPLDGSAAAEGIVAWIDNLAAWHGAEVIFLHVAPGVPAKPAYVRMLRDMRARMLRVCERMGRRGVAASFRVDKGNAAARILDAAREVDLVATTTHGRSGARRLMLGSVAEEIIRESPVPVIVYRGPRVAPRDVKKVVLVRSR